MSRTKGSKNKPKVFRNPVVESPVVEVQRTNNDLFKGKIRQGKGRPLGSKNKVKNVQAPVETHLEQEFEEPVGPAMEQMEVDFIDFEGKTAYNCCGHDIAVKGGIVVKPHTYLRLSENSIVVGHVQGIPVYNANYSCGAVPARSENKIYIVSNLICTACPDREDFYIPFRTNYATKECLGLLQNPYFIMLKKTYGKN